ncbi:MAG: type III-A CRISPR-associated RAMP protein Csm3 [Rhodocyclaceae bacterium]|nr:CRISPR type III-associated RAMP protein Csm3 [Bacteroidia bacterium]MCQ3925405.1 type III-A CRISPR-associated RAMP protein Csm3 [Rhodocyclaceae bacterium]
MQLTRIRSLTARLTLETGLHIGAGDTEMHIGGTDNAVVKHPITNRPYIPGSSLKGKMRSLLEWKSGAVKPEPLGYKDYTGAQGPAREQIDAIVRLFGVSGGDQLDEQQANEIGPTRLAFWDCDLAADWVKGVESSNQMLTEVKSENRIDRIRGVAEHPRNTERVPAGAEFDFRLSLKVLDGEDLLATVLAGLRLIELDSLGGSGSRGYGKVKFNDLRIDGETVSLPQDPFAA